jgi:hypothetical protein
MNKPLAGATCKLFAAKGVQTIAGRTCRSRSGNMRVGLIEAPTAGGVARGAAQTLLEAAATRGWR